ncbi:hypothetical protein B1813_14140 [Saccharomonospora piscinae]|uniref:Glycoprotein n=1 Tax=Saccharomonospora piscinae TaxID=687388 RepID=A0A1V9A0X2_SACPI|nr:DUF6049 family protein [Saccharomonospora piscinae]OQO90686.1 hypothetical protein B1813_14140 [Saccharomonospora piscinae]
MTKRSAFVLALLFLAVQSLFAAPGAPRAQAQTAGTDPVLRVRVESMSPRLAGPDDTELTVDAVVTNVGDRPVSDIVARAQVGQPQSTPAQLAQTLAEPPPSESGASPWVGVPERLGQGESARLTITAPLARLGLTEPGVYPLLINVNGTPASGSAARLGAVNLLLPVLGDAQGQSNGGPAGVSVLWPIAPREPKVVGTPHGGRTVLSDDALATSLAPGGRLHALVAAAESRRGDTELFGSLCFAVDPDLLDTVDAMSRGYAVRTDSGTVTGRGTESARRWLDDLRALVANHCVVALPYADADLGALAEVDSDIDLVREAVASSATILNVLNLEPRRGTLWARGELSDAALEAAAGAGATTVITSPDNAGTGDQSDTSAQDQRLVPYDPLVADGFALASARYPGGGSAQPAVGAQNAVGAVALRGGLGAGAAAEPGQSVLLAPPHDWTLTQDELSAMLDSLGRLHGAGLTRPVTLEDALNTGAGAQGGAEAPAPGGNRATSALPDDVIDTLSEVESTAADLRNAMSVDPTRQVEPVSLIQPLHNAVIRATSTAWRGAGDYRDAAAAAAGQVRQLSGKVSVSTPSQPVSLASESSPLPVTLSNDLPVSVTVRITLDNSPGLRPAQIDDTPLAAHSRVSRLLPAETLRSGRFMVNVSLATPGGTTLGHTSRMELTSSEFGEVMVVLTATAGVALVLLAGRRIYRRVRTRGEERG